MSTWKVIKTKIEIFDHPDAEKLQVGKVGTYQVVVQKGLYNGGEEVIFAPEKSVLSGVIEGEYKQYLVGKDKNRVKSFPLRGMLSCGIIIPEELVVKQCGKSIEELPYDEDLSELLGISKYVPPVPTEMNGVAVPIEYEHMSMRHDVEQFGVYAGNFVEGEKVVITEKLHGSQVNAYMSKKSTGEVNRWVSTKNYNAEGLCLVETDHNFYWRCVRNVMLFDLIERFMSEQPECDEIVVQVFGEALPCQALKYGLTEHTMRIFKVALNGRAIPYDLLPTYFTDLWVPVLYIGPYGDVMEMKKLALGNEQLSGQELHIKEGIVIIPNEARRASDGTWLHTKVINSAYKETGEEFN